MRFFETDQILVRQRYCYKLRIMERLWKMDILYTEKPISCRSCQLLCSLLGMIVSRYHIYVERRFLCTSFSQNRRPSFPSLARSLRQKLLSYFILSMRLAFRDGAMVKVHAFHQCVPGLNPGPGLICGLSLLIPFSASRVFSPDNSNSNSLYFTDKIHIKCYMNYTQ